MTAPKPKHRWLQFSLRTLLIFVTFCAIPCSWLAIKLQHVKREKQVAREIESLGGYVIWSEPTDHMFPSVYHAILGRTKVSDAWLVNLNDLKELRSLNLQETAITDAGLENLKGMTQLKTLFLGDTKITHEGAKKLKQALPNCEFLRM